MEFYIMNLSQGATLGSSTEERMIVLSIHFVNYMRFIISFDLKRYVEGRKNDSRRGNQIACYS